MKDNLPFQNLNYKLEFIRKKSYKIYNLTGNAKFKECLERFSKSVMTKLTNVLVSEVYSEDVNDCSKVFSDNEKEDIVIIVSNIDKFDEIYKNNSPYCKLFIVVITSAKDQKKYSDRKNVYVMQGLKKELFEYKEIEKYGF